MPETQVRNMLFVPGEFTSRSGKKLDGKIECDALTDEELKWVAKKLSKLVRPFNVITGVHRGGDRLAEAMWEYMTPASDSVLVVDDVLTTGKSILEEMAKFGADVQGAVIFARGPVPQNVEALFRLMVSDE